MKSQTGASSTTVWLAMNLNVLLDDLKRRQDWSGLEVALSKGVLQHINVVPSKGDGNAGLLRNIPPWPELLQKPTFKEERVLAERRGVRNRKRLPPFRVRTILAWVDAYRARHQKWPAMKSGPIPEAPGETWNGVDSALEKGLRGLTGKSSLAKLLAEQRGVRHIKYLPRFTITAILAWADAFFHRYKEWPTHRSGPIRQAPGETWGAVHTALQSGGRGLPKGSSLPRFLERYRKVRNMHHLARLTYQSILRWADTYHRRTDKWPTRNSGELKESHPGADIAPGESWGTINSALHNGGRGLPGGSSLARLLESHRAVPNKSNLPRLTYARFLRWADAHHRRTGRWPRSYTGPIPESPGENWRAVIAAFHRGRRGLPGDCSFAQLLNKRLEFETSKDCPDWPPIRSWPGLTDFIDSTANGRRLVRGPSKAAKEILG